MITFLRLPRVKINFSKLENIHRASRIHFSLVVNECENHDNTLANHDWHSKCIINIKIYSIRTVKTIKLFCCGIGHYIPWTNHVFSVCLCGIVHSEPVKCSHVFMPSLHHWLPPGDVTSLRLSTSVRVSDRHLVVDIAACIAVFGHRFSAVRWLPWKPLNIPRQIPQMSKEWNYIVPYLYLHWPKHGNSKDNLKDAR